jgi:DNA-binding MarR family transcriptional regulator
MSAERDESGVAQLPGPGGLAFQSGIAYLLGKLGSVAKQRWTATLAEAGVSPSQFRVLMTLAETGPVCQRYLAGAVGVDPRNVVAILDSLEVSGFISRETDPADRRRRLIELTGAGRRIAAHLAALGDQAERELMAPVPQPDQEVLRRILRRALAAAEGQADWAAR